MLDPLSADLSSLIREHGPLPFDRFMDLALYHPRHGFYASGRTRTGKQGDFLTPVSPGPVLGQLLARQADDLHQALGRPTSMRLIEQGADTGWLARDLLASIHEHHPLLAKATQLHLVEPHPRLAEKQKKTLISWDRIGTTQWHPSWETVPEDGMPCFFYSCELVDSFPMRIFRFQEGSWRERLVGLGKEGFVWQEKKVDPETLNLIHAGTPPEVEDFTIEIRPGISAWLQDVHRKIPQGLMLTLDYGYRAAELLSPRKSHGTLVAIRSHQRSPDPLADPGTQDLTAHVNFTELEKLGNQEGFRSYGLTDFAHGLTALATPLLKEEGNLAEAWIRNFRHLTHPSFFGQSHQILVQGKSLPASFSPSIVMQV